MRNTPEQNWHPITMLPMFAKMIDGQLNDDVPFTCFFVIPSP